jgi:hypothetical protein
MKSTLDPNNGRDQIIENDINIIVGGNFTPDAMGPDVHGAILARVRTRPRDYLTKFEEMFLLKQLDPHLHSKLYLPRLLEILIVLRPRDTRRITNQLLSLYLTFVHTEINVSRDSPSFTSPINDEESHLKQLRIRQHQLSELLSGR